MTSRIKQARVWIMLAGVIVTAVGLMAYRYVNATGDATFAISPTSGSYTTGNTINVAVSETSSASDNTNAVQVNLTFPTTLSFISTTLTGPFTLCAQNTHTTTTVSLACASSVAVSGTQAIATIAFSASSAGSATVAFASGSDIDNTTGQSVFSGTLPSSAYSVTSPTTAGTPTPTPTPTPKTVTSTTSSPTKTPTPSPSPIMSPSPSPTTTAAIGSTGSLSVTINDGGSHRVDNAQVDLAGQTKKTNASGVVNFAGISSGTYVITITAPGHKLYSTMVTIDPGQNKLVSYTLQKEASAGIPWLALLVALLVLGSGAGGTVWYLGYLRRPIAPASSTGPAGGGAGASAPTVPTPGRVPTSQTFMPTNSSTVAASNQQQATIAGPDGLSLPGPHPPQA